MRILVVGTPKRDFHIGFDTLVLGLNRLGVEFDHYPDILTRSHGHTGTYGLRFDTADIRYPDYGEVLENLKKKKYGLVITTVCRVDYRGGRHGIFSFASRKIKYKLPSNRHKLGGTLVLDWLKKGIALPPIAVVDDLDDPFIHPVDFELLRNCAVYFKRELPFDRFLAFRLRLGLTNSELVEYASKLRPIWISYDTPSMEAYAGTSGFTTFRERDIDISYLCNIHMSSNRVKALPIIEALGSSYRVITSKNGKVGKSEFYGLSRRSRIALSLEGRGWDCPKHYELLLCGALLFIARPTIEVAIGLKDGENCVFVENDLQNLRDLAERYLKNPALSEGIAKRGYELAKNELSNSMLARYVIEKTKEVI